MEKFCKYCNTFKDIDDFSKHHGMKDGHLGKCKVCASAFTRKWYRDNITTRISYEKERSNNADRKVARIKYQKEGRERNALAYKSHNAVSSAIREGRIVKQPCQKCGLEKAEAHHPDYSKPLEIEWLCRPCHMLEHGKTAYDLLSAAG
jgi:hypothetical protein